MCDGEREIPYTLFFLTLNHTTKACTLASNTRNFIPKIYSLCQSHTSPSHTLSFFLITALHPVHFLQSHRTLYPKFISSINHTLHPYTFFSLSITHCTPKPSPLSQSHTTPLHFLLPLNHTLHLYTFLFFT